MAFVAAIWLAGLAHRRTRTLVAFASLALVAAPVVRAVALARSRPAWAHWTAAYPELARVPLQGLAGQTDRAPAGRVNDLGGGYLKVTEQGYSNGELHMMNTYIRYQEHPGWSAWQYCANP